MSFIPMEVLQTHVERLREAGDNAGAADLASVRRILADLIDADVVYDKALADLREHYRTTHESGYIAAKLPTARSIHSAAVTAEHRRFRVLELAQGGAA